MNNQQPEYILVSAVDEDPYIVCDASNIKLVQEYCQHFGMHTSPLPEGKYEVSSDHHWLIDQDDYQYSLRTCEDMRGAIDEVEQA